MKFRLSLIRVTVITLFISQLFNSFTVTAQEKLCVVKGIVHGDNNQLLIGVSVVIRNSKSNFTSGTITDSAGVFSVRVPAGGLYSFSFSSIGYETNSLSGYILKEGTIFTLDVPMKPSAGYLDQVVVIGYGTQKKSSLTASVASISSKEVQKQIGGNVASAFQGRVPGVEVVQQGGIAGADINIVIRGAASFGSIEPLYVVDGIFSNSGLSTINPIDIESIEILKDGSAAAIYGSRAANGVVLITTKKGKAGKPLIEINSSFSFQKATNIPEFLNATEWRKFANMVADNSGMAHAPENDNPSYPDLNTDWAKEWLQFAPVYNLNASISGGNEYSSFNTSFGYYDQTGMTIYSGFKKYNLRVNHAYKKGRFSFSENVGLTYRNTLPTTPFSISLPTLPVYDTEGRFTSGGANYYIDPSDGRQQNKIAPLFYTKRFNEVFDVLGGINASIKIFSGLEYKFSAGGNYSFSHGFTHTPVYYSKYKADGSPDKDYGNTVNSISESRGAELNYTIDNILTYKQVYKNHSIDALLGTSWLREFDRNTGIASIADLGSPSITGVANVDGKISAGESNAALLSFFSRINYDYKNKYLFSASLRRDESSKFYKDYRVGYFPSVSAGWNIEKESFFKSRLINKFKIRASYGELGANFLNPYNFDPIAFGPIPYTYGNQRYVDGRGAYLKSKGLKWETAKTSNIGIDLSFFHNKFYISTDYFIKKNTDLLAAIDLNLSSGQIFEINTSREKPYINTASVENRGWEILLGYRDTYANGFKLDASLNVSGTKNKVLALGENVQPITSGGYSSFFNDAPSITKPGYGIGSFYGYKIKGFSNTGDYIFSDENKDGIINADDKVILGSPIPDFSYGLNLSFSYKNFDVTMFFQGVYGNQIFNAKKYTYYFDYSNNVVKDVLNAWTPDHKNTNIPIMKIQNTNGGNALPSEFYIEDGSYFRFKNLQIGYSFPGRKKEISGIKSVRVFGGIQNLLTITNYTGYDPEVSSNALFARGIDFSSFPNSKMFNIGFNLTF